jgi:ATP-dependent Clp protease ATP-binding subunit ClpA
MYPFERFSEDGKRALMLAQEEAERAHHLYIGTEHLLLGLMRIESSSAHRVLTRLDIAIDAVREAIKTVLGRTERILVQQMIPTSRVKKVIEIAFEEARRMGHAEVDTAHLLLGLVIEGEGIAAHVLADLGAPAERVIAEVERDLGAPSGGHGKQRGRRRLPFSLPGRASRSNTPASFIARPEDLARADVTDLAELARLLRTPQVARVFKARGVDAGALSKQLSEPPANVAELRRALAMMRGEMMRAAGAQEFERATEIRDQAKDLLQKLEKAEQDWLDSFV